MSNNRVQQLSNVQSQCLELFARKNIDYGDAFAKYGLIGVLMRIEDKMQRCISITNNGINFVSDEGLRDTLMDLHNYAAMATMLYDENNLNLGNKSSSGYSGCSGPSGCSGYSDDYSGCSGPSDNST